MSIQGIFNAANLQKMLATGASVGGHAATYLKTHAVSSTLFAAAVGSFGYHFGVLAPKWSRAEGLLEVKDRGGAAPNDAFARVRERLHAVYTELQTSLTDEGKIKDDRQTYTGVAASLQKMPELPQELIRDLAEVIQAYATVTKAVEAKVAALDLQRAQKGIVKVAGDVVAMLNKMVPVDAAQAGRIASIRFGFAELAKAAPEGETLLDLATRANALDNAMRGQLSGIEKGLENSKDAFNEACQNLWMRLDFIQFMTDTNGIQKMFGEEVTAVLNNTKNANAIPADDRVLQDFAAKVGAALDRDVTKSPLAKAEADARSGGHANKGLVISGLVLTALGIFALTAKQIPALNDVKIAWLPAGIRPYFG